MTNLDFLKDQRFEPGLEEWANTPSSKLVDVRTAQEYAHGHIPGAINIPLQSIKDIEKAVPEKATALFIYCQTGTRSGHALLELSAMGYRNAKNIGGINGFAGNLERVHKRFE